MRHKYISCSNTAVVVLLVMFLLSACSSGPPPALQFLAPLGEASAEATGVDEAPVNIEHVPTSATISSPPPIPTSTLTPTPTLIPMPTALPLPTPTSVPPQSPVTDLLDSYLTRLTRAQQFHGSVLVVRRGTILLSKGYGWANKEEQIPNSVHTRFRLASISKQFTALAIMQLQAQGKLKVHDPICNHLANCPSQWRGITIHHLLTHTSGLPNYTDFPSFGANRTVPTTPEGLIARFRHLRLLSSPGTVYTYQNSDYVVLGLIIEQVSQQTYADFLRTSIFEPLEMSTSGVAPSIADGTVDAVGYRFLGQPARPLDPSTLYGCGSLASTVEDLYRWDQALSTETLLPASELEQIFTPYHQRYGYGWFIDQAGGRLKIGHPGKIDGFTNSIVRYPEEQVTVIVLSNLWTSDAEGISAHLANLVFKHQ